MPAKTRQFWTSDWFAGVLYSAVFLLGMATLARGLFYAVETVAYDKAMAIAPLQASDRVTVVEIDDESIDNIGRWPWSRDVLAAVIDRLAAGGARVIAMQTILSEPSIDPGAGELEALTGFFDSSALAGAATGDDPVGADLARLRGQLVAAVGRLDYDATLAASLRAAGNVVLPLVVQTGETVGAIPQTLPDFVLESALTNVVRGNRAQPPLQSSSLLPPVPSLGASSAGTGVLTVELDQDGALRSEPLVVDHYGTYLPSLALIVTSRFLNLTPADVEVRLGAGVALGNMFIETSDALTMYTSFHAADAGQSPFARDSFWDVFSGLVPVDKFRDKIVLIGPSARGVGDSLPTPVAEAEAPVMILANTISSLLQRDYVVRPDWAGSFELALLLLLAAYLIAGLPRLRVGAAAAVTGLIATGLLAAQFSLLIGEGLWLHLMAPLLFLVAGHVIMSVKRSRVTERLRLRSEADSAESNRMLGLAFQGQGQLDLAFEKFRKCPMDDGMSEVLYNLALDYERKRQFNKAGAVYRHIQEYDPEYRDVAKRQALSQSMDATVMLGLGSSGRPPSMNLSASGMTNPMLGRYVVEKEIGKGAMGTVYLGRDPKINRVVAIKTIALSEEFDEDELQSAKDRFFREAESAGRLNHPDIVTVFDAGEEHDLAYIAMEFLKGDHLNRHTRPPNLLPTDKVLHIVSRAAEALAYAHREGVVHRDIKPANIMYDADADDVKITDFGVARITDSSKTKTGIVLGTPSYMSPEQLSGHNVTGCSDLFSLGVTLYQLLTGQLPFRADSMATLMFRITNEPPTPLAAVRPDLPDTLGDIIDRVLAKDPEDRFQSGTELALALRQCCTEVAA